MLFSCFLSFIFFTLQHNCSCGLGQRALLSHLFAFHPESQGCSFPVQNLNLEAFFFFLDQVSGFSEKHPLPPFSVAFFYARLDSEAIGKI